MLDAYFVVARTSENIIRLTHQGSAPADSLTVFHQRASSASLVRYQLLLDTGRELMNLDMVMPG